MYAFRQPIVKTSARRFASTGAGKHGPVQPMFQMLKSSNSGVKDPHVPEMYNYSVKKAWFSDSATYPLIATLAFAGTFILGMSYNALHSFKDVRINPDHKHQIIRDWGAEKTKTVAEIAGKRPVGLNARRYTTLPQEGLGVDHEEWLKAKKGGR